MINFDHSSGKSRKLSVILYALIGFVQLVYLSTVSYYESFFLKCSFILQSKLLSNLVLNQSCRFVDLYRRKPIRRLALAY